MSQTFGKKRKFSKAGLKLHRPSDLRLGLELRLNSELELL
jgi:hypothetical protein